MNSLLTDQQRSHYKLPGRKREGCKARAREGYSHVLFVLLVTNSRVIQSHTNGAPVVSVVLPDDTLAVQFPQPRIVVGARSHQISTIGTKSTIPNPTLVAVKRRLKRKGIRVAIGRARKVVLRCDVMRLRGVERPDAGGVVGRARGEVAYVGREENAGDVGLVCKKGTDRDEGGDFGALNHAPDVDLALCSISKTEQGEPWVWGGYAVVACTEHGAIAGDGDAGDGHVGLGDELVRALVLAQIPDAHIAPAIAADQLALIRVDDDIIDRDAMGVVALHAARACVPDLDGAILGARHHPLALAMEGDAGDVGRVAFKGEHGIRIRRLDLVELDRVVAGGGEEALVGRDAEAVDLRVGMRDRPGADAGERFPEAAGMSVSRAHEVVTSLRTGSYGRSPLRAVNSS